MSVLWSVLAGIGTVLLFLLKGVGILLLVVLVLGLLLMFCPFCADVQCAEGIFQVKAGALGITFPVFQYPKPEPPPTSAQARSSATIFPALPLFFFSLFAVFFPVLYVRAVCALYD